MAISGGIDSLGTGLFFASFVLYFVGVVGIGPAQVALTMTVAGLLAMLTPVPLGCLADWLGPGRIYVGLLLLRGLGYCFYPLVSDFKCFFLLTVLLAAADRSSSPLQQLLVTAVVIRRDANRTMASIRAVRNFGLTAGYAVAAAAFATAEQSVFTVLFLANGLSYFVAAAMLRSMASRTPLVARNTSAPAATRVRSPFRDRWFMVFTVGMGILWLHDAVLVILLPIWVIKHTSVPAGWVPVFMAMNTVLTALLQVYIAKFAKGAIGANRLVGLAGILLVASCGSLAIGQVSSTTTAILAVLVAVIMLSIAENMHAVAAWELSAELSPKAALGRYLGAFSLAFTGQQVIGPAVMAALMPLGLIGWPALAGAFGAAALVSRVAARRCLHERAGIHARHNTGNWLFCALAPARGPAWAVAGAGPFPRALAHRSPIHAILQFGRELPAK